MRTYFICAFFRLPCPGNGIPRVFRYTRRIYDSVSRTQNPVLKPADVRINELMDAAESLFLERDLMPLRSVTLWRGPVSPREPITTILPPNRTFTRHYATVIWTGFVTDSSRRWMLRAAGDADARLAAPVIVLSRPILKNRNCMMSCSIQGISPGQ